MVCDKCGSSDIEVKRDSRELPVAYCKACGQQIKRLTTTEMADLYDEVVKAMAEEERPSTPCPYCTEKYVMLRGNERTRVYPTLLDVKYCPVCGRKLTEKDRAY